MCARSPYSLRSLMYSASAALTLEVQEGHSGQMPRSRTGLPLYSETSTIAPGRKASSSTSLHAGSAGRSIEGCSSGDAARRARQRAADAAIAMGTGRIMFRSGSRNGSGQAIVRHLSFTTLAVKCGESTWELTHAPFLLAPRDPNPV